VGMTINETMDTVPLPESVVAEYNSIINGVTECVLVDEQIIDFMIEGFNEYKTAKCLLKTQLGWYSKK